LVHGSVELTLADLLAHDELGLELVVGGDECVRRAVSGAHAIEIDEPARWLDRDWIMLTTGVRLSPDPDAQRALIAELDAAHVTALGFGLGVAHDEIPAALLDEASRRGFPVFAVPFETAFREVIGTVQRTVLSAEIRASNRLAAMQRYLMDALGEEQPEAAVLERLSSLTGTTAGILAPHGAVQRATGELPGADIAAAIRTHRATVVSFETEGVHGHAFPIGAPHALDTRWLAVAAAADRQPHPLTKAAAQSAVPVLAAIARMGRAQAEHDRAIRRATLEAVLDARGRQEARIAAARALECGVDIAGGVTVIVVADPTGSAALEDLLPVVETAFASHGVAFLGTVGEDRLTGVVPATIADDVIDAVVLREHPALRVGVGRAVDDPAAIGESRSDARLAVNEGARRLRERIVRYDDLDLGTVLITEVPLERLAPKIRRWLDPLESNPLVYETLVSYLRHDLDVGRTARALHLHPNSVRYRLSRAEQLMGAQLRSSATIAALHIALLSDRPMPRADDPPRGLGELQWPEPEPDPTLGATDG
jgi:purine catabolism regulator